MHARLSPRCFLICLSLSALSSSSSGAPRLDLYGDPLPDGTLARMGTVRLRHNARITAWTFSPDGKTLAVGDFYSAIHFWDIATGKENVDRRLLDPRFNYPISALRYAADGKTLTVLDFPCFVRRCEPASGKQVLLWEDEAHSEHALFSPDGETLAQLTPERKQIRLRQRATGKVIRTWKSDKYEYCTLGFSPDGKILAAGCDDGKIRLLDVGSGKERRTLPWDARPKVDANSAFVFSPNGKSLVWWSLFTSSIHFCDPNAGKERRTWKGPELIVHAAYSPDGKLVAVADTKGTIHWLESSTGKEVRAWKATSGFITALPPFLFSPDGKILITRTGDQVLQIWESATGKMIHQQPGHTTEVCTVAFSPDGKTVASGDGDSIRLWDAATGRHLRCCADSRWADALAFSPDGKILASAGSEETIRLWNPSTGKALHGLTGFKGQCYSIAFSPDGKLLAGGGYDKMAGLWDVASGKVVHRFAVKDHVSSVAFSPDGKSVATGEDETIQLWDVAGGKQIRQLGENLTRSERIAFSPDGKLLAAGGGFSHFVALWDVAAGKVVRRLRIGEEGSLGAVVFSPDGKTLATAQKYQFPEETPERIQLWETRTGKSRGSFRAPPGGVASLAFAPDGKKLAAGNEDTTILIWDVASIAEKGAPGGGRPSDDELDRLWDNLADADAERAFGAIWRMAAAPDRAVSLLSKRLRSIAPADPERVARMLADLDSDTFAVREKASAELGKIGGAAESALRKALAGRPRLEVRLRIKNLLEQLDPERTPAQLRILRAVEVLEHIGSPEAKRLLQTLAQGFAEASLTQEAKASLQRLAVMNKEVRHSN